jgi:hypothetical protein
MRFSSAVNIQNSLLPETCLIQKESDRKYHCYTLYSLVYGNIGNFTVVSALSNGIEETEYFAHQATLDEINGVESIDIQYFNKNFESAKESTPDSYMSPPQWFYNLPVDDDDLYGLSECTAPSKSIARLAARTGAVSHLSYQFSASNRIRITNIVSFREETSENGDVWLGLCIPKNSVRAAEQAKFAVPTAASFDAEARMNAAFDALKQDVQVQQ